MDEGQLLEAASFTPSSLQPPEAWCGHLPFAWWLIRILKPKVFVELGTHSGNSYFSFCQSVKEAKLDTKCYAVDTWRDAEHAGYYGEEVFDYVNAHNQAHYASFSRLLRMTFDEALSHFVNKSVDLLHIDGLQAYEAVKHNFESWLPKLSPGAVLLFHGTNVRERGFGVWKLWEELKAIYPNNLEFLHSHGLGVLQIDGANTDKKLPWLHRNYSARQQLINYFAALGARQMERFELGQMKAQIANLNQVVTERDGQIANLNQAVVERDLLINQIIGSASWRVTKPLRSISQSWRRARDLQVVISRKLRQESLAMVALKTLKVLRNGRLGELRARIRQQHYLLTHARGQLGGGAPAGGMNAVRPLEADYSVAIPFGFDCKQEARDGSRIAAIIHLYYEELADEFRSYLCNVPGELDVFISTTDTFKAASIECAFSGWEKGQVQVRVVPNRGRDIAPKLVSFGDIYDRYDYVIHLHGKRSLHSKALSQWRHFLLENLVGTPRVVESILYAFKQFPNLGMVSAQHFEPIRPAVNWGSNFPRAQNLAKRLGFELDEYAPLDFPSGSMFWARTAALRPLLEIKLKTEEFDVELNQTDGALGHAIERIFFHVCEHAGFQWIKVARPELFAYTMNIIDVPDKTTLSAFFRQHIFHLLDPQGVRPRAVMPTPAASAFSDHTHK
jgi:hypothetical protein